MVDMREASCDPNPLCSEIFAPRHVEPYETFTAPQECIFEDLCTSFKALKPYNTSDDYFLDLARVKPLPSPSRTEEYFLLHEPRIISVLEFACNTPLPDISSDEESSSSSSLFSPISSCSTLATEASELDRTVAGVDDSTILQIDIDGHESAPAEPKEPNGAVSAEQSSTVEHTTYPKKSGDADEVPVTGYEDDIVADRDNTVRVAAAGEHGTQANVLHPTQPAEDTTRDVSTAGPLIIHEVASQTDAMEVYIPEPTRSRQFETTNTRADVPQAMDGIESPLASRDTSTIERDDVDDVQVTSRVDTEEQTMVDAPPPESTTESRARSRVQANKQNHWSNGKTAYLLVLVRDLHLVLQQALPEIVEEKQSNQIPDEILNRITKARSARELADDLDFAMTNKLLSLAQFNKLDKYAKKYDAKRRQQQESARRPKVSNSLANNGIGFSQAVSNGTAQPASLSVSPLPQASTLAAAVVGPVTLPGQESVTREPESLKERFSRLFDARTKVWTRRNMSTNMFAGMLNVSFQNLSDVDVMMDYIVKHPVFQARDSNGRKMKDIAQTVNIIQTFVNEEDPKGREAILWTCMEGLAAQNVKAEDESLSTHITCATRQKFLVPLFRTISACNLALMVAVNGDGTLPWDEMRNVATAEERHYFQSDRNNLVAYKEYMKDRAKHWGGKENMKKLIADRIAAQNLAAGQAPAPGPVGGAGAVQPSKAKRSLADTDHDDKEQALKRFRDEPAQLTEEEERTAMRKRGARGPAGPGCDERVKRSRD
jgi:hypothetical protein